MIYLILFLINGLTDASAQISSPLANIQVAGALDGVTPISFDDSANNKMLLRSADLIFFGPIDHTFDGQLNLTAHLEDGQMAFELEEGFLSSSKLIPRSRIKAGKFLLGFGRLNTFHAHDWPFVNAPKVHREFLSPPNETLKAESAADTGLEYSYLLPLDRFVEVTLGVTNGYCYGHCDSEGERPRHPLYYVHPSTFFELGQGNGLLLGASHMRRHDASDTKTELSGIDLTFKSREGKILRWLVQSELLFEHQTDQDNKIQERAGGYVFIQKGMNENWLAGLRADVFSHLNRKFESTGESRKDLSYALVPTLTYNHSEFTRLRLAYSHEVESIAGEPEDQTERQIQLQFVFILGAHPSHNF